MFGESKEADVLSESKVQVRRSRNPPSGIYIGFMAATQAVVQTPSQPLTAIKSHHKFSKTKGQKSKNVIGQLSKIEG
ncbi:hypothetical protein GQ42DRAFT_35727 [Ramicandelaber brevisporus]|nr:hypothetical protein GQ42DRAFT_50848 [Ramicandelaber brevisporus]KAI8868834.1 hypothetical protein GQ42DRAFT_35727 [Ramicandelaber brevisporus]